MHLKSNRKIKIKRMLLTNHTNYCYISIAIILKTFQICWDLQIDYFFKKRTFLRNPKNVYYISFTVPLKAFLNF